MAKNTTTSDVATSATVAEAKSLAGQVWTLLPKSFFQRRFGPRFRIRIDEGITSYALRCDVPLSEIAGAVRHAGYDPSAERLVSVIKMMQMVFDEVGDGCVDGDVEGYLASVLCRVVKAMASLGEFDDDKGEGVNGSERAHGTTRKAINL
jgi:hypothetical protein